MIFLKKNRVAQCTIAIIIFCTSFVTSQFITHKDQLILSSSIDMRDGPGVFYEWTGRLFEGTAVQIHESEEGWLLVSSDKNQGWIPDYRELFEENEQSEEGNDFKERRQSIYSVFGDEEYNSDDSDGSASPTQVAAAVRGFSRQYSVQRVGKPVEGIELRSSSEINPREYLKFKRERIGRWNRNIAQRRFEISSKDVSLYDHNYESIGWAVAKRLAGKGIVHNQNFQSYLNLLGLMVTESSHRYEIPLRIYLLDQDSISGYSTPAGIIFISKAAVEFFQSEAELVFFIAHELAHLQFKHGSREIEEREIQIRRDEVFRELGQLLNYEDDNDEYERVSEELSSWADQVFEYLVSERLDGYEYEADYWALVYMFRLGYNPESALQLLRRLQLAEGDLDREIGILEWQGPTLESRIERMLLAFQEHPEFSEKGILNNELYQDQKQFLR